MPLTSNPKTKPKYLTLASILRQQIADGVLKPGDRLPSFPQMRLQHGATPATVERVYALLGQQGLISRQRGRGIFVADTTTRSTTGVIGLAMDSSLRKHPYYVQLLGGIQEAAHQDGFEILFLHGNSAIKWEKMDGVLMCTDDPEGIVSILPPGMPHISLLLPHHGISSVIADDRAGSTAAVDYLIELGHRRIAFLTGVDMLARQRQAGYREALRKAKIVCNPHWVRTIPPPIEPGPCYFVDAGRRAIRQWLKEDWQTLGCTALLAHNDEIAIGAIDELQEAGVRVPEQLSVVGFDGTEITTHFRPRLTTVEVPLHDIGETAARLLLEQIAKPLSKLKAASKPVVKVLSPRLRVRESSAWPTTM